MGTAVDTALAEVAAALAVIQPQLEGLRGLSREPLSPESAAAMSAAIATHAHRVATLTNAQNALDALLRDGYPTVPSFPVTNDIRDELQQQVDQMVAALERFIADLASALGLHADAPVLK